MQLLIAGACGALPAGRIPDLCDALYAVLKVGLQQEAQCLLLVGGVSSINHLMQWYAGCEQSEMPTLTHDC